MTTADRDRELVNILRCRDPTAAERLVATYGKRAHRLASRIVRNAEDAEEIIQDAFWSVLRRIDTFRGDSGLRHVRLSHRRQRSLREAARHAAPARRQR